GVSSGELCRTLKDEKANGGKDLAALLEHVSHDKLVLWGWSPGVGRDPVSVPHSEFAAKFKVWVEAGAPCPRYGSSGDPFRRCPIRVRRLGGREPDLRDADRPCSRPGTATRDRYELAG